MHLIEVPCACADIELCRLQRYISDVRILEAEHARLVALMESTWQCISAAIIGGFIAFIAVVCWEVVKQRPTKR